MLQRTDEVRCAEGVVDDEGDAMLMCDSSYTFEVEHVGVGVTEGLGIYNFRVGLDGSFKGLKVVYINNGVCDALGSQCVGNEVVGSTIEIVGSDDMVTSLSDVLQGIGNGSSTRGNSQACYTTLESSDAIFEYTLSRVGQATIDITCITKTETVGGML